MTSAAADNRTIREAIEAEVSQWPCRYEQNVARSALGAFCARLGILDARVADLHVLREGQHVVEEGQMDAGHRFLYVDEDEDGFPTDLSISPPFPEHSTWLGLPAWVVVRSGSSRVDAEKGDK